MSESPRIERFFSAPTIRLAAIHLAIILLLSTSFSVIFYHTSTRQFARPLPQFGQSLQMPDEAYIFRFNNEVRDTITNRFNETRQALLLRLFWINMATLIVGSVVSYLLARWSLRPIEEAMTAQTQFVSDASHELRTPLAVLQTTNEVALRKSKLPAVEARSLIAHNVEEVKKLRDLSNMLLDMLKNTDEPVTLQPVNLQDAVSDAMSSVVAITQEKDISIEDSVPELYASTDQALLARIIAILLDNAVKYSDENKQIRISAKQSGKKVLLSVTDQGIGMRATDIPFIFNRFYRADKSRSTASSIHGYGLGLSIAQKIAQRLDTTITVKSAVGKGSTFTVELPADRGADPK